MSDPRGNETPRFEGKPRIFPAIDLRGGRVVRLIRGESEAQIGYGDDPVSFARRWIEAGADRLHVIDLGGAFGEPHSLNAVATIVRELGVPVQTGGGIRDADTVARLLAAGVARVIVGTRALKDAAFLRSIIEAHGPGRVVLAMDIADGRVKVSGWTEDSSFDLEGGFDFARENGVETLLVTAIDRDGTLGGANMPLVEQALAGAGARDLEVVVAGGIGKLADIEAILALGAAPLQGVVVGRALYEGTVDLGEAVALTRSRRDEPG